MNDIVVFSHILKKHVNHLRQIFQLLNFYDIRLSFKKSYFDYFTITLLSQKMNAFDLTITTNKFVVIANLKYFHILKDLKIYFEFTEWLKSYIIWYAQKFESLQRRKTFLLREFSFSKNRQRKMYSVKIQLTTTTIVELKSYRQLQKVFRKITLLVHHDSIRPLYIDVNVFKRRSIEVIIYHLKLETNFNNFKRSEIEFIMFLSRMLTLTKKRYWLIELKMADLIWVVRRVRHFIEVFRQFTIVYTNHAINIDIVKQITLSFNNTNKFNFRLMRVSIYFFQFRFDVRYRFYKKHVISNALFRLSTNRNFLNDDRNLNLKSYNISMTNSFTNDQCLAYNDILVSMFEVFRDQLLAKYVKEKLWINFIAMLIDLKKRVNRKKSFQSIKIEVNDENTVNEEGTRRLRESKRKKIYIDVQFNLKNDFIYHKNERRRLCISISCEKEVFRMTHDDQHHVDRHWCYQVIFNALYVSRLFKKLRRYLKHCSQC